jgi:hypothetical protein
VPGDEIVLTLPRERGFGAVAGLVLGGVAARHDLTIDVLDDLRLALETLLEQDEDETSVRIVLRIDDAVIEASVGPFEGPTVDELEHQADDTLGLRRLLDTVVDRVVVDRRPDGCWVELHKGYVAAEDGA